MSEPPFLVHFTFAGVRRTWWVDYFQYVVQEMVYPWQSDLMPATLLHDIERGLLKLGNMAIRDRANRLKKKVLSRPLVLHINFPHMLTA